MKKLALILAFLLTTTLAYGEAGDITKAEVREDVSYYRLYRVDFLVPQRACRVIYMKYDSSDNALGEKREVFFRNVADNPDTPEDETSNEFTQLVNAINSGNNIKTTISNAVKIKLGIN